MATFVVYRARPGMCFKMHPVFLQVTDYCIKTIFLLLAVDISLRNNAITVLTERLRFRHVGSKHDSVFALDNFEGENT